MSDRLTAFAMIGNHFRQQRETYQKMRENVLSLTDDEVEQLLTMCDDKSMREMIANIRKGEYPPDQKRYDVVYSKISAENTR